MKDTSPFFILSSGRSGSQMFQKLFCLYDAVEMHHEYLCNHIQPLAVKYYLGLVTKDQAKKELSKQYEAAIYYSDRVMWGDSSNKLSWLIEPLNELFPNAKFIHIIRDGRKVVSSFYNKLRDECYDDKSTKTLQLWVDNPEKYIEPPHEKKYWWNVENKKSINYKQFINYNQFQRICYHWHTVNSTIENDFIEINEGRKIVFRLEDLVTKKSKLKHMLKFLGLKYREEVFDLLKTPHNVNVPKDFLLNMNQIDQFNAIAGETMKKYGYNKNREYKMNYKGSTSITYSREDKKC